MKLELLEVIGKDKYYSKIARYKCYCGTVFVTHVTSVKKGDTKSCGCKRNETQFKTTHGKSKTSEYSIWVGIRKRCRNKKSAPYKYYGARGIKICSRWDKFENFLSDMGPRPSKLHSVERMNNNGDYEPNNCKWATAAEQTANQGSNYYIEIDGVKKCSAHWCKQYGISVSTFGERLKRGMNEIDALTIPVDKTKRNKKAKNYNGN